MSAVIRSEHDFSSNLNSDILEIRDFVRDQSPLGLVTKSAHERVEFWLYDNALRLTTRWRLKNCESDAIDIKQDCWIEICSGKLENCCDDSLIVPYTYGMLRHCGTKLVKQLDRNRCLSLDDEIGDGIEDISDLVELAEGLDLLPQCIEMLEDDMSTAMKRWLEKRSTGTSMTFVTPSEQSKFHRLTFKARTCLKKVLLNRMGMRSDYKKNARFT